jgi:hypothetical protein
MKNNVLIRGLVVVLFVNAPGMVVTAEEKASSMEPQAQIISKKLLTGLVERRAEFAESWWPADLPRVRTQDVPQTVYAHATRWLRTMIKSTWLPNDPNAWMVGVRKTEPRAADCLILRYAIEKQRIQIQEDGAGVALLIDTGSFADVKPDAFLTSVIRKFLRYPEDKLGALKFYLENFEHEGKTIYYGTVDCDFDRYDTEAYFKRTWYNHTFVWTDGRRAFFSLVESTGEPPQHKQARPGIPRRFKPAE